MDKAQTPRAGPDFNVLIVGAGGINFGCDEGPWNHSIRLEHKLGPRLKVVGLIDPFIGRSMEVLRKKRDSFVLPAYEGTVPYKDVDEAKKDLGEPGGSRWPRAIILGAPPAFRGSLAAPRNLEATLTTAFPGVPLFVEKPVSTDTAENAYKVAGMLEERGTLVGVGYVMRYLKAVQEMKNILAQNNLKVMATNARYAMAYPKANKWEWWDKTRSCGPIVEQATHFVDLCRYLAGEVDTTSVLAHSLEHDESAGKLSKMSRDFDENDIAPDNRIPRITSAIWKYESGAVGSLTHAVALQGTRYMTELEVYADGWLLKLVDPYNDPTLHIWGPEDDTVKISKFLDDDPFYTEISRFIDQVEGVPPEESPILSSYLDAVKTYELTWAIRLASERGHK